MDFGSRITRTTRTKTTYIRQSMHFERTRTFGDYSYSIKKLYTKTHIQREFGLTIQGLQSEIAAGRLEEIVQSPPILIRETTPAKIEQKKSPPLLSLRNYKTYY